MNIENITLKKIDNDFVYHQNDTKIVASPYQIKSNKKVLEEGTIIVLSVGKSSRKITIKHVTNVSEAIRDSLETMASFTEQSTELKKARLTFRKKLWPKVDGKTVVPTFENVDVEELALSPRALTALEKNGTMVLGQVPNTLEEIKKLKSVGGKVAEEIFESKKSLLKKLVPDLTISDKGQKKSLKKNVIKTKPVKSAPKQKLNVVQKPLIVGSNIPINLQKILTNENSLFYIEDIPLDINKLLKLNKLGPAKARQILDAINHE